MKNIVDISLYYAVCSMKLLVRYVYRAVKLKGGDQHRLLHCVTSQFVIIIIIIQKLAATACYSASY